MKKIGIEGEEFLYDDYKIYENPNPESIETNFYP